MLIKNGFFAELKEWRSRESIILKPRTGPLARAGRASCRLVGLLVVIGFVASTLAQSAGSRLQPNTNPQARIRQEAILTDLWSRSSPQQRPPASGFRALADRAEPANKVPAEFLPLEPATGLAELCVPTIRCATGFSTREPIVQSATLQSERPIADNDKKAADALASPVKIIRPSGPIDFNQTAYYKNKTEFGLDIGWLPVNIPFVFDIFLGDGYNNPPLYYTLVPIVASLRWQMNDVGGPWIFRGNWDLQTSLGIVPIARGPETHYFAWIVGVRRNFVPHLGKIAPYFDFRLGLGRIDAKEPLGVLFAQGQDFTFTMNLGSGLRYNFNQKYSISAGMNWMHISNAYLSEPRYPDYGINVYGPMFGINVRLGKSHQGGGS